MTWNDYDAEPRPSTEEQLGFILKLMAHLGWPSAPIAIPGFSFGFDDWEDAEARLSALDVAEAADLIKELLNALEKGGGG